ILCNTNHILYILIQSFLYIVRVSFILKRGENARSLELLSQLQKNILQLIRIAEENADNWFNMTKNLEKEISPENYEKFKKTTARLNKLELYEAYKNSLLLVME